MQDYEKKHLSMLRPYLPECMVLLKSNGAFPLEAPGEIALYGSGARRTVKGGTGSGEVNSRSFLTVEQGLRDAGFTVTTSAWMDAYDGIVRDAHARFIRGIKNRARARHTFAVMDGMGAVMPEPEYDIPLSGAGDTAVYVLSRISGEGNDRAFQRGDVLLTESEKRDILYLQRNCPRFLLVLNVGGPVDLEPVLEVENILILSQLGSETGGALADLILGKTFPSGKLATTWAAAGSYPDIGEFGDMNDTRYREGIYVGYRYFDSAKVRPLFPSALGWGILRSSSLRLISEWKGRILFPFPSASGTPDGIPERKRFSCMFLFRKGNWTSRTSAWLLFRKRRCWNPARKRNSGSFLPCMTSPRLTRKMPRGYWSRAIMC